MDEKVQRAPTGIPEARDSPKGTSSELVTDAASDSRSLAAPAVKGGSPGAPPGKRNTPAAGAPVLIEASVRPPRGQRQPQRTLKGDTRQRGIPSSTKVIVKYGQTDTSEDSVKCPPAAGPSKGLLQDVLQVGGTWETSGPKGAKAWAAMCTATHAHQDGMDAGGGAHRQHPGQPHTPMGTVGANETTQHWNPHFTP